ncbi:MAG TPA: limonene-1,2-epoxide hydrolase family protein [Acidimicrobiales bacterium]
MTHRVKLVAMTPEETVDEFIRRVLAHDLDGACELASEDIEYDNVPIGKNIGHQAMKDILTVMAGIGDVTFEIHRQVSAGRTVMNERTDRFEVGERRIDLPVAGVFELDDDGKICLWRDYFDYGWFERELAEPDAG